MGPAPRRAHRTKPPFLYEPRRGIETYRRILAPRGLGAAFYAGVVDEKRRRFWLLIEKVPGAELWQIGDFATWEAVARWLARFHRAFEGRTDEAHTLNPHLLQYDADLFHIWARRAIAVAAERGADRATVDRLQAVAARYDEVVGALTALPTGFIHGEVYPSNVLVGGSGDDVKVWPVDWEMAAVGPPLLDLAALVSGWESSRARKLVDADVDELGPVPWHTESSELAWLLDGCRLHYAFQWAGWSPAWRPPPEHARDWPADAIELATTLGL